MVGNKSLMFWHSVLSFFCLIFIIIFVVSVPQLLTMDAIIDWTAPGNYLRLPSDHFYTGDFLVNNSNCRIPNINIWHKQVKSLLNDADFSWDCTDYNSTIGNIKGLTSVNKQALILNEMALSPFGLTLNDIKCCYQVVERVEQDMQSYYTWKADSEFRYSLPCYPMEKVTNPHGGFIRVTCNLEEKNATQESSVTIHSAFHLVAVFPDEMKKNQFKFNKPRRSYLLSKKITHWKKCREQNLSSSNTTIDCRVPTNVLLIGIDSLSRMHFRRMLPTATDALEKDLNAFEMKGYTKVGINTFANIVPLLTSFSAKELETICFERPDIALDNCPFLWKHFSAQNYLTAYMEDRPDIAIFNYLKTGFVKEPVDIYIRPLMLAAYEKMYRKKCIGYQRPDQVILQYMKDLTELATTTGIPYFITVWLSDLTHNTMSDARRMDGDLKHVLLLMKQNGLLENTLLFVLGDHGYRFLKVRQTLSGWYEDKLPALWIKLPETMEKVHPSMRKTLKYNSNQLVTPFDIHETIKKILDNKISQVESQSRSAGKIHQRGRSLFQKLPERSCEQARVPPEYCVCGGVTVYTGDSSTIRLAANAVINKINREHPSPLCVKIKVHRVTAVGISRNSPYSEHADDQRLKTSDETDFYKGNSQLIIGMKTSWGLMELEAVVMYNVTASDFIVVNVFRTNRLKEHVWCLGKSLLHDTFCDCHSKSN